MIGKHPATPKAVAGDQPQSKAEAVITIDQPKPKAEATIVTDQPKPKAEAVPDQLKAKVESVTTDSPKAKADPIVKADPPKAEAQPKPLLSLASLKGRLGFGPPSKPERPPVPTQVEVETLEDDENADIQAALHESLKAPSSPQPESGAQSSTPKPATNLDQQESELIAQLDRLMEESVRLESLPNPSVRDRSRLRSIDVVSKGIEKQLKEIEARRVSSPSIVQPQASAAPVVMPSATTPPLRSGSTVAEVKMVSPPSGQPLTLDKLMSGIVADTSVPSPKTAGSQDQRKALPIVPSVDHPKPKERSPVRQARPESPPRVISPAVPAIEDRPTSRREAAEEPLKERERTPRREPSRERRRRTPSPPQGIPQEERQPSPAPTREPSRERRRRRRSPTPHSEHSRERRRRSPTPPVNAPGREGDDDLHHHLVSIQGKKEDNLHLVRKRAETGRKGWFPSANSAEGSRPVHRTGRTARINSRDSANTGLG